MFCPECGCMLPEGTRTCKECGLRIKSNSKAFLSEEQPNENPVREELTSRAKTLAQDKAFSFAACALVACSLFMGWLNKDTSGLEVLMNHPFIGNGDLLLNYTPAILVTLAVISALCTYVMRMPILFATGIIIMILSLMFGIQGHGTGFGPYLAIIGGTILMVVGLRNLIRKNN